MDNRNNSWLIFAKETWRRPIAENPSQTPGRVPKVIGEEMSKSVHCLPTKSGAIRDRLPTLNLSWVGAEIVKVELNDARSGKGCKSLVSSPLLCLDGTWWAIDVNDPDLEAHLKQSARCGGVLAAVREQKTISEPEPARKGRQRRSA
ncbi:hypothetical protein GGD66_006976 [Bradyrhizobium sp. CIR48]|uniref:hypothetical protein n=1 Tax=Bradyrhizobium sp. CIR48 TaxID=2663840 RepID=UPI0016058B5E|nr:hypothetical protein [Bradyrhizobium sp. CIR48]MBB4428389.1 hypothetical protein [Bradyrhizobium sp. CIR48]